MNYFLSEFEEALKNLFCEYVDKRIIPIRKELDERRVFAYDIFEEMAQQDFFRIMVPEEYGGMGESQFQLILGPTPAHPGPQHGQPPRPRQLHLLGQRLRAAFQLLLALINGLPPGSPACRGRAPGISDRNTGRPAFLA